jgi:hypothetical protein
MKSKEHYKKTVGMRNEEVHILGHRVQSIEERGLFTERLERLHLAPQSVQLKEIIHNKQRKFY